MLKCFDWKTKQLTALKVIRNKKRFHQQALIEVKLLKQLKQRDVDGSAAVVHVTDDFYFRSHMCITFEMLSMNLYEFIKKNNFQVGGADTHKCLRLECAAQHSSVKSLLPPLVFGFRV